MDEDGSMTMRVDWDARGFERAIGDLENRASRLGSVLSGALKGAVVDGRDLESVLLRVGERLSALALDIGLRPLEGLIGEAASGLTEAFTGRVVPFAAGGVVSQPTYFPMGGDIGLMGEAGAEAILPLARGADGRLGVAAGAAQAGGAQVVFNVTTAAPEAFRKSEAQVTAMLARAVGRGTRGL